MNHQDFEPEIQEKKNPKVFYGVLAACAIAVCGAIVTTITGTLSKNIPETPQVTTKSSLVTTTSAVQQVVIPATNIPDDRTTVTTALPTTVPTTAAPTNLFVLPVSNRVLRSYSETHQYSETLGEWRTHNGVDFVADKNQSVKAVADGTVKTITGDALWGDVVEIDHGEKRVSRYCGVAAQGIKVGDCVKAGEVIGKVTTIPSEIMDAAHVHLEILVNGNYLDPLTLIQGEVVTVPSVTATTKK